MWTYLNFDQIRSHGVTFAGAVAGVKSRGGSQAEGGGPYRGSSSFAYHRAYHSPSGRNLLAMNGNEQGCLHEAMAA